MIDTEMKRELIRELMLFGAYLADAGDIRSRINSSHFVENDIAACIEEIEGVTSGRIQQQNTRFLPFLLDSLECPNGGNAIDGIEQAVKANTEYRRMRKLCQQGAFSKNREDLERITRQFHSA